MTEQRHHFAMAVLSLLIFSIRCSKPCQVLHSRSPFPLLSIGISTSHVTLITRKMTVFEVPLNRLNLQTHQINLTDIVPVRLFAKWPSLSRSLVREALTQGRDVFTTTFDSSEYLNIIDFQSGTVETTTTTTSFGYDLSTGSRINLLCYDMLEPVFVPTTSSFPFAFPEDKLLVMTRVLKSSTRSMMVTRVAIKEYNHSLSLTSDYTDGSSFALCLPDDRGGSSGSHLVNSSDDCKSVSPIVRAFMLNQTMYLFDKDGLVHVVILGKNSNNATTVERTQSIPFEHFFICSEDSDHPSNRLTTLINILLKVAIIIALLFALILLVVLMLTSSEHYYHQSKSSIGPLSGLKLSMQTKVKRVKKHRSSSSDESRQQCTSRSKPLAYANAHQRSNSSSLSFPRKLTGLSKGKKTQTKALTTVLKSKRFKTQKNMSTAKSRRQARGKSVKSSSSQSKSAKYYSEKDLSSKTKKSQSKRKTRETSMMKTVNVKKKRELLKSLKGLQDISRSRSRSRKDTSSNQQLE